MPNLRLLHLSDIHFRQNELVIFDDLRSQLERATQEVANKLGGIDGILITGDIAFSGAPDEYRIALNWLDKLCNIIGCKPENVWSIPGNHDVERSAIRGHKAIQTIQRDIRKAGPDGLDICLSEYFRTSEVCEMMYRSINNYVTEFAAVYKCEISAAKPFVEHDFELNDGSILRIRGVNSTIVSFENDDDGDNKLVVGSFQATMPEQDGVEYLLMCHHPYDWLLDHDKRQDHWNSRAKIQLFGHKHRQRVQQIDSSVVMGAGAVQPSERESPWEPRFNVLNISTLLEGEQRFLEVEVFSRVWKEEDQAFNPDFTRDGLESKKYKLKIKTWTKKDALVSTLEYHDTIEITSLKNSDSEEMFKDNNIKPGDMANKRSPRRLTYTFLRLPYHIKIKIGSKLDLLRDEDNGLKDSLLFQRFFRRAVENSKIEILWKEVEAEYEKMNQ